MKSADTLEELAELIGVDAEEFVKEVEKFNGYVDAGFDADFFRGESPYDCGLPTDTVTAEDKKLTLGKIEKAPFFAGEMSPSTLGSCGGPRINEHAQIMHTSGDPIGRLYACGNVTGFGGPGKQYGGAGGTLGPGFVMGFIAANHIIDTQTEDWS